MGYSINASALSLLLTGEMPFKCNWAAQHSAFLSTLVRIIGSVLVDEIGRAVTSSKGQ